MSTAALVRAAWATNVWGNASVTAITTQIHNFDLAELAAISNVHAAKMYYAQQINFIQYRVSKQRSFQMSRSRILYTVPVFLQIFRDAQDDLSGTNYNALETALETIFGVVWAWSATWSGTVDFWRVQTEPPALELRTLDGRAVWAATYSYVGEIETTI